MTITARLAREISPIALCCFLLTGLGCAGIEEQTVQSLGRIPASDQDSKSSPEEESAELSGKRQNWNVFVDKTYGFQVKYPCGWDVIEARPRQGMSVVQATEALLDGEIRKITFLERGHSYWPGEFRLRILENKEERTLKNWVKNYRVEDVNGDNLIQVATETTLDGKPAFKLSIFGFDQEEIAIVSCDRDGSIFLLEFTGFTRNDPHLQRHHKIYERMLGSFAFTE